VDAPAITLGFVAGTISWARPSAAPSSWSAATTTTSSRQSLRSPAGRRAMAAFRRQRALALCAPAKLDHVEHLLGQHKDERAGVHPGQRHRLRGR
jgi:hypothetical protein